MGNNGYRLAAQSGGVTPSESQNCSSPWTRVLRATHASSFQKL